MTAATGSSALLFLVVLACPIGMGLMMVFMGRGMGMKPKDGAGAAAGARALADLKAEQARLAEKIGALEREASQPASRHAAAGGE